MSWLKKRAEDLTGQYYDGPTPDEVMQLSRAFAERAVRATIKARAHMQTTLTVSEALAAADKDEP